MRSDDFFADVQSSEDLDKCINWLIETYREKGRFTVSANTSKPRTRKQQNALEVWCRLYAKALNDAGWDMKKVLANKPDLELEWTQRSFKEVVVKTVVAVMFNVKSTSELDTVELGECVEMVIKNLSTNTGVYVPFPSLEAQKLGGYYASGTESKKTESINVLRGEHSSAAPKIGPHESRE